MRPLMLQDTGDDDLDVDVPWPEDAYLPPRRRRLGAWMLALVVAPSLGVLGWAAEKRYHVAELVEQRVRGGAPPDARVESFLADGERALSEGNLDGAQGDFDKASVLADRDRRVLVGQARVAAAKADIPWLKLRLLPPGATESARVTGAELEERVAVARHVADDALSAAPQDPARDAGEARRSPSRGGRAGCARIRGRRVRAGVGPRDSVCPRRARPRAAGFALGDRRRAAPRGVRSCGERQGARGARLRAGEVG